MKKKIKLIGITTLIISSIVFVDSYWSFFHNLVIHTVEVGVNGSCFRDHYTDDFVMIPDTHHVIMEDSVQWYSTEPENIE